MVRNNASHSQEQEETSSSIQKSQNQTVIEYFLHKLYS